MTGPQPEKPNAIGESDFEHVLADYLQRVDRGEQIDQQAFMRRHPALADELRSYFETASEVERMAGPVVQESVPR